MEGIFPLQALTGVGSGCLPFCSGRLLLWYCPGEGGLRGGSLRSSDFPLEKGERSER